MRFALRLGIPFHSTLLAIAIPALAQTNYWLKPGDGFWHEPHWSLNVLPASNQTAVEFSSHGSKRLVISSTAAARSYRASLRVREIVLSARDRELNTLLLDNVGLSSPLQCSIFNLGVNSALTIVNSALNVSNEFHINGLINHGGVSRVVASNAYVGDGFTAHYNLTNGTLSANTLLLGYDSPATFRHYAGATTAGTMEVREANYFLHAGNVSVDSLTVAHEYAAGLFQQNGGRVTVTNSMQVAERNGNGRYELLAGALHSKFLRVGTEIDYSRRFVGSGEFIQRGGTNRTEGLAVGKFWYQQGLGTYRLSGGLLASSGATIGEGGFEQSGGIHAVDGQFAIIGVYGSSGLEGLGHYSLAAGAFSAQSLTLSGGRFEQSGGTNEISGSLALHQDGYGGGQYELRGGKLVVREVSIYPNLVEDAGIFRQTGGVHIIGEYLNLNDSYGRGSPVYDLVGGELTARDIYVGSRAVFRHTAGTVTQRGKLRLAGGQWESGPGNHQLGIVELKNALTNSAFWLPRASAVLRFGSSAAVAWDTNNARLVIYNWQGSLSGSGNHQVIFGNSASGLTTRQLSQIRFRQLVNHPPRDYEAAILETGEVVPRIPNLTTNISLGHWKPANAQMTLLWAAGFTLQTATNAGGPFTDVADAMSPFTTFPTNQQARFFRLRH